MERNKKIYLPGVLFVLAAVCLVTAIFAVMSRAGYQSVYLNDTKSNHNGWEYEIRTDSGGTEKVSPRYTDEYSYTLSDGNYNAVKETRIMTEELAGAGIQMDYAECGIEVFLEERLLYSDFQTTDRDAYGYLLIDDGTDIGAEPKSVTVSIPEDYKGKTLTIITYFSRTAEYRYPVTPCLQNLTTVLSPAYADAVRPMLWLVFLGSMVLVTAVCYMFSDADKILRCKMILLFLVYVVSFIAYACHSNMGYYSGLQEWTERTAFGGSFDINTAVLAILTICAAALLALEIWEGKKKPEKGLAGQLVFFGIAGLIVTAFQKSTELDGGIRSYFPTILVSAARENFVPLVTLCTLLIIYTVTFLTVAQFVKRRVQEWQKNARLLERGRFARENYELIMQVDEDSRRRNHEMRHHMETLHSLLGEGETDKAAEYIEKTLEETGRFAKRTYSENIVVNAIVGSRLNRAKEKGIAVRCHIHVPRELEADDVDLSLLLSNMLENAAEACMRMEDRTKAYIRLEIRKKQKFLFIECENSVDRKEIPDDLQKTLKSDRKNHGFGLDAMRAVAEKYASIIQIEREPGSFTVRTNLCLPK